MTTLGNMDSSNYLFLFLLFTNPKPIKRKDSRTAAVNDAGHLELGNLNILIHLDALLCLRVAIEDECSSLCDKYIVRDGPLQTIIHYYFLHRNMHSTSDQNPSNSMHSTSDQNPSNSMTSFLFLNTGSSVTTRSICKIIIKRVISYVTVLAFAVTVENNLWCLDII